MSERERERERERENPTTHDQTQQFSCPGKKRSIRGSNPKVRYSEHAKAETWVRIEIEKNFHSRFVRTASRFTVLSPIL